MLLDPLPGVPDSRQVLEPVQVDRDGRPLAFSYLNFRDFRERSSLLDGILPRDDLAIHLRSGGSAERVWAEIVSSNFFDVLGVRALHGRTFLPEEDASPGKVPVMLISYGLWQRSFGGDPSVIGSTVEVSGHSFTLIGVKGKR